MKKMRETKKMFGRLMIMSMSFLTVVACQKQYSAEPVPSLSHGGSNSLVLNRSVLRVGELSVATAKLPPSVSVGMLSSFKWEVRNRAGILQPQLTRSDVAETSMDRTTMSWSPAATGVYRIVFSGTYDQGKAFMYVAFVSVTL